jgi:hypothetical protein
MRLKFGAFLAAGFFVLATIATAAGNFAVRLEAASQGGQTAAAQPNGIAVERLILTQGPAAGHRRFTERSSVVAPGTGFNIYFEIYFEPTGLATRFDGAAVRAAMSVDILIRNAQGQTVVAQDNAWRLPIVHAATRAVPLPAAFGDLTVNPLSLPDGRYQIVLRIHDDLATTHVDRTLDIELRAATAQRLSQAPAQPLR